MNNDNFTYADYVNELPRINNVWAAAVPNSPVKTEILGVSVVWHDGSDGQPATWGYIFLVRMWYSDRLYQDTTWGVAAYLYINLSNSDIHNDAMYAFSNMHSENVRQLRDSGHQNYPPQPAFVQ